MENHEKGTETQNFSILYLLAAITGILTGWVVAGSIMWMIIGALLGLLTTVFFINVLVKGREET